MITNAITCEPPKAGNNTRDIPEELLENGLTYLQSYTYSCLDGFSTTDDLCTVCKPDGTLSITPPNCTGKCVILIKLVTACGYRNKHRQDAYRVEK